MQWRQYAWCLAWFNSTRLSCIDYVSRDAMHVVTTEILQILIDPHADLYISGRDAKFSASTVQIQL